MSYLIRSPKDKFSHNAAQLSHCVPNRYRSGTILLLDVKRGGYILQKLRGHDEEVHSLVWCPIPGEEFKPAAAGAGKQEDITDLETFGVGKC